MSRVIAEINRSALANNVAVAKVLAPNAEIMAMVKANAYGHGVRCILPELQQVDYYGVATFEEGRLLQEAGAQKPIVVMLGPWFQAQFDELCQSGFHFVLHHLDQLAFFKATDLSRYRLNIWLKMNTGMNRLGLTAEQFQHAYQFLSAHPAVQTVRVLSHLGTADQLNCDKVAEQVKAFEQDTSELTCAKSLANGAAMVQYPESHYDIVRPGLLLYGVNASQMPLPLGLSLQPVMTLKSYIIDIHQLEPGQWVGYGSAWQAAHQARVATVCIGYGDGYSQSIPVGTPVLVNQQRAQTVGRVSMDSMTIDISHLTVPVKIGDAVTLWGEGLPIETVGQYSGLSAYALLTGVSLRVKRIPH